MPIRPRSISIRLRRIRTSARDRSLSSSTCPISTSETSANLDYFLGAPKLAQVYVRLAAPATQLAALESGELHVMQALSAADAERLATSEVVNIVPTPGVGIFQTAIFNERFPDKRVRQAFMYGVDRQALMDVVLQGQGRLVNQSIIGPEWAQYDDLNDYPFDPEQAKALLEEAGWDSSQTLELIWEQGVQAIELCRAGLPAADGRDRRQGDADAAGRRGVRGAGARRDGLRPGLVRRRRLRPRSGCLLDLLRLRQLDAERRQHDPLRSEELDQLFVAGRATPDIAQRTEIYHRGRPDPERRSADDLLVVGEHDLGDQQTS